MRGAVSVCGAVTLFDHILHVPRLEDHSSTVFVRPVAESAGHVLFGGCGANQVASIASLGGDVELLGVVGADFDASGYRAHLEKLNVDLRHLSVASNSASGHSYLIHDDEGHTFLIVEEGAATLGKKPSVDSLALSESTRLLVLNMPFDLLALSLARLAVDRGKDVLISGQLGTAEPAVGEELMSLASYVCCNIVEATELKIIDDHGDRSSEFDSLKGVWITRGTDGIRWIAADRSELSVASVPVRRVVDPTGGGDGVVAGIALAIANGASALEATRSGAVAASFIIEQLGCQESLPIWSDFKERYRESYSVEPDWLS